MEDSRYSSYMSALLPIKRYGNARSLEEGIMSECSELGCLSVSVKMVVPGRIKIELEIAPDSDIGKVEDTVNAFLYETIPVGILAETEIRKR